SLILSHLLSFGGIKSAFPQVLCESVRHLKGKSPGVAELSRALICSYRKEDFAKSSLFRSLSEYQATYQLDILS
ncbi:hypothetical protein, partial [uncultured Oscillibacter sp.]|uniref:hypothetical protein n=1 Tax=uncultured Oscillibacter sp. TaxID=876091 RepID=UPI00262A3468